MQVVDQQERRHLLLLGERQREAPALLARGEQQADDPLQPGAVHLHDRGDQLLRELACGGIAGRVELRLQLLHAHEQLVVPFAERRRGRGGHSQQLP